MLTLNIQRFTRRATSPDFSNWETSSRERYNLFSCNGHPFHEDMPQFFLPYLSMPSLHRSNFQEK